ncbi:MAG: hypothetical protein ACI9ES_000639 [Oceanospirillaceae bacterium]|jgi:uncharacterized protein (DUF1330 family)
MAFEILLAMEILDEHSYSLYRKAMTPILHSYQGKFGYDFKVSQVLICEENPAINRVFTLTFSNQQQKEKLFSDPEYLAIKEKYFVGAVGKISRIASYEKPD